MSFRQKRVIDCFIINPDDESAMIFRCNNKGLLIKERSSKRTRKEMSESFKKARSIESIDKQHSSTYETEASIQLKAKSFIDSPFIFEFQNIDELFNDNDDIIFIF